MTEDSHDLLRRLAIGDARSVESLLGASLSTERVPDLDARTCALVRLAGLIVQGAPSAAFQWCVADAVAAGASDAAIVGVLAAVGPVAGSVRVGAAAPEVALALGCELDDEPPGGTG